MGARIRRRIPKDDDPDDRLLTADALKEARLINDIRFVENGAELLEYLRRQGDYAPPADAPRPGLILLDLNMPKMDGRSVLKELKMDPDLRSIPVVVLTTSSAEEDVARSYDNYANAYVTKPVDFEQFMAVVRKVDDFFLSVVRRSTD